MWLIIKNQSKTIVYYFKRKCIKYYLYKKYYELKKYEVNYLTDRRF